MSSTGPRTLSASETHPLLAHASADAIAAWRGGAPVCARELLRDVAVVASALPVASHVLNLCSDRYRFAVALLAAVARGQVTLLPPTTTPDVVRSLRAFAPDAYYIAADDGAS